MAATTGTAGAGAPVIEGNEGIEFGIYLPQVAIGFEDMLARALECERLGYDSLWLYDHLYAPAQPASPSLEAWTLATALLARTSRLRVGHLVLCNNFRHPAVLAKMATTLDVISGGRLDLGPGVDPAVDRGRHGGSAPGPPGRRADACAPALRLPGIRPGGGGLHRDAGPGRRTGSRTGSRSLSSPASRPSCSSPTTGRAPGRWSSSRARSCRGSPGCARPAAVSLPSVRPDRP